MSLAEPFVSIFNDPTEAHWAFDLLQQTVAWLGITDPYDPRVAITVSDKARRQTIHLDFGNWLVLGFARSGRVSMALLGSQVYLDSHFRAETFARQPREPAVYLYQLPMEMVNSLPADLQLAYRRTLLFISHKFQNWKRSPYLRHNRPEMLEAVFNPNQRARLLTSGVSAPASLGEETTQRSPQTLFEDQAEYVVTPNPTATYRLADSGGWTATTTDPYSRDDLVADIGYSADWVARVERTLHRKGQLILYGPPGTGKTFLAERLARYLTAKTGGLTELIQFHPAYAYEDFMIGIRPTTTKAGQVRYEAVEGHFLAFCQQAEAYSGLCVLIIDEINRANLAQVFGELMYLLENRTRQIQLAGGAWFSIPVNVRLIGTMNTADRSVALVDHALRRRFAFLKLQPNYDLLTTFHQHTDFEVAGLIGVLQRLNQQIGDPHYAVGVTFFLYSDLSQQIADIWQMEIEPYLAEYFFAQPDRVEPFRWSAIAQEVFSSTSAEA